MYIAKSSNTACVLGCGMPTPLYQEPAFIKEVILSYLETQDDLGVCRYEINLLYITKFWQGKTLVAKLV